jgi:hypothetical protein
MSVRGFTAKNDAAEELLETVGVSFLTGYGHAVECPTPEQTAVRIAALSMQFRGFAYEGAGMGYAMLDGLPFGHSRHVAEFLAGPAADQVYITYVGVGWALARLPRFRWRAATAGTTDPLLRWLVLDGYGFHQAYFHTRKYVHEQYTEVAFPWPADAPAGYANRVIDQGVGRAIWFVAGSDPDVAATLISRFDESRHSDLYAGVGLAATYAGGVDDDELRVLRDHAGRHGDALAQGSAFAAEARAFAGIVIPQTELATRVLCGTSAVDAAEITHRTRENLVPDGDEPVYETWRLRITEQLKARRGTRR